jgi:hypothetical protein
LRSAEEIRKIPVHFILCTERTGSSLLSLMLNLHNEVICTSEELFALYFYKRYENKVKWTETELKNYIEEFWLMSEQNLDLNFTSKEKFYEALFPYRDELDYGLLLRLTYLQFIEPKSKDGIKVIVDKQIKYLFYLPVLLKIFPDARFIVLVRDVRDNVVSRMKRKLNLSTEALFLSSVWNYTYRNVNTLLDANKQVLIVKYEDLVSHSADILQEVCSFLGVGYDPAMIQTDGVYDQFLQLRRKFIGEKEFERLKAFNSELSKQINTENIGSYDKVIDKKIVEKIVRQNHGLLKRFNYDVIKHKDAEFVLRDKIQMAKAYLYRPFLLSFYYRIPLGMKLWIKKMRRS